MRRFAIFVILVAASILSAVPAFASDDFAPYFEEQAAAEFSGEETIVCHTPDGVVSELSLVRQADGVRVVEDSEGAVGVTRVSVGEDWVLGEQYRVGVSGRDRFLSRNVDVVEVFEGDLVRVVLFFDQSTGALLASDVNNADGSSYCSSRFLSFDPAAPAIERELLAGMTAAPGAGTQHEVDASVLPAEVAGFTRMEASDGPADGVTNAYYADGLFSFTLFVSEKAIEVPELAEAPEVELASGKYTRQFYPGRVIFAWQTRAGGFVLVGDLPLDLQDEVLEALPAPGQANFFVRFWRGLFG